MSNVTYLLGAGASCQCLPTYANFGRRIKQFKIFLSGNRGNVQINDKTALQDIINLCESIEAEFIYHNTPDTIAKKYFHLHENGIVQLKQLKTILILFFIYEQCINEAYIKAAGLENEKMPTDKRYDAFIASILEPIYSKLRFYKNFNIITWNYDQQFEICYNNYRRRGYEETLKNLQTIPSLESIKKDYQHNADHFTVVHLNGIAFSKKKQNVLIPFSQINISPDNLIKEIVEHYHALQDQNTNEFDGRQLLNFAWERHESYPSSKEIFQKTIDAARSIADKTEVLVIIGYSFPIFNRDVDQELLVRMKKLKRIYVQSPNAEAIKEVLVENFSAFNHRFTERIITTVKGLDYFHIPAEWNRATQDPFKVEVIG
jgi:hypothetical protein